LGQGKGTSATWPETQRQLFVTLLGKRSETPAFNGLCNVPVFVWLYFGDNWVPLRQVRRALATWSKSASGASWQLARARAAEQVRIVAHPQAPKRDREALTVALAKKLYSSRLDTFEDLRDLFERVMDPERTQRPRGPASAPLDVASVVDSLEARRLAVARLKTDSGPGVLPDSLFHWGRSMFLTGLKSYQMKQPMLSTDPEMGDFFPRLGLDRLASTACLDLVTILGMGLQMAHQAPSINALTHPRTWEDNGLTSEVNTQQTGTGVAIELGVKKSR
jgi:hypothetical protein